MLGIFNMRIDVSACNCTWEGLYQHDKRICTENLNMEEKSLATPGNLSESLR